MFHFNFMRSAVKRVAVITLVLSASGLPSQAAPVSLGEATRFAILSRSSVTNTGASVVNGDIGVSPAGSITGFESATQIGGAMHWNTPAATQAQSDLAVAYDAIAGETATQNLTGQDLGGQTLTAGVYRFNTSAQLTGSLILDAQNDPNARFVFQIGSTLTTASLSTVTLTNGGSTDNVYWQVGSSATLGTNTVFQGNILALTSVTLTNGATNRNGRVLARNGAVTLDTNVVGFAVVIPEAGTLALAAMGCSVLGVLIRRRRVVAK